MRFRIIHLQIIIEHKDSSFNILLRLTDLLGLADVRVMILSFKLKFFPNPYWILRCLLYRSAVTLRAEFRLRRMEYRLVAQVSLSTPSQHSQQPPQSLRTLRLPASPPLYQT